MVEIDRKRAAALHPQSGLPLSLVNYRDGWAILGHVLTEMLKSDAVNYLRGKTG